MHGVKGDRREMGTILEYVIIYMCNMNDAMLCPSILLMYSMRGLLIHL